MNFCNVCRGGLAFRYFSVYIGVFCSRTPPSVLVQVGRKEYHFGLFSPIAMTSDEAVHIWSTSATALQLLKL